MASVLLCILDGIQIYLNEGLAADAMCGAGKVVTANYNRALYERYHLFFLDSREKSFIVSDGMGYVTSYCSQNRGICCKQIRVIEQTGILEEDCKGLKEQIKDYVVYQKIEEEKQKLLELKNYQEDTNQKAQEQIEEIKGFDEGLTVGDEKKEDKVEDEENASEDEQDVLNRQKENIKWKELKALLKSIFHSGILLYVADERAVSHLKIDLEGIPSEEYGSEQRDINLDLSFDNIRELMKLLKSQQEDIIVDFEKLESDLFLLSYLDKNFRDWQDSSWNADTALRYEMEYIVAGKDNDNDNLKHVAERIFLSRFVANYGYILTDAVLVTRADEMAIAVTGVLGVPEVKEAVRQILLAALSCGEALLDVHTLFAGKKVPLLKNRDTWMLSFENAIPILKEKTLVAEGEKSLSYKDYMKLFLLIKGRKGKKELRMADIMQWNIKLDQPDFELKQCIASYMWEADFLCKYQYPNLFEKSNLFTISKKVGF